MESIYMNMDHNNDAFRSKSLFSNIYKAESGRHRNSAL